MRAARPAADGPSVSELSYRSASFHAVLHRLARFARDDTAPLLLQGESGTGKTRLARRIHALSPRASGPFQHVVLSTLDDGVASSELFGHVAGAFTDARRARAGHFASASGGTLFLDEIGKASRALQAKLLHALEYGEIRPVGSDRDMKVDVRIVAATNIDLANLVERGEFLPDLRARLTSFRIALPPLRERRADIPALVSEAIQRHARAAGYGVTVPEVHPELMDALRRAPWPDNLRELDAAVHRLLLEADGQSPLTLAHCIDELSYLTPPVDRARVTREQIDAAVKQAGSLSGAARVLGVDRKTLRLMRRETQ